MLTETNLRKIKDFSAKFPVVSVYLNTEPSQGNAETHRLRLRNMLKKFPLKEEGQRIEDFFAHHYDWSGRSVAVFACQPVDFFEFIPLSMPVKDFVTIASKPELAPLEDILQEVDDLGVVLVDRQGARYLYYRMGELVEQQGYLGEDVKHVKSGSATSTHGLRGGSIDGARNAEEKVERNMRAIRENAIRFFRTHHIKRIMIAGSEDNVAQFKSSLPKEFLGRVTGTFTMGMSANHIEILNKVMQPH